MSKRTKKYIAILSNKSGEEKILAEAVKEVKKLSYSKFNGSIELHFAIKVPKDTDPKSLKGSVSLPHSAGKAATVIVFAEGDKAKEAKKAGADKVGLEDLIKDVQGDKIKFDVAIATPDVMPKIAVLGRELGPKGLMPNPKTGTVTEDITTAVSEYKKGKQKFASDDSGAFHFVVGKVDMDDEKVIENVKAAVSAVVTVLGKPFAQIAKTMYLAPSMGPSVKVTYQTEA